MEGIPVFLVLGAWRVTEVFPSFSAIELRAYCYHHFPSLPHPDGAHQLPIIIPVRSSQNADWISPAHLFVVQSPQNSQQCTQLSGLEHIGWVSRNPRTVFLSSFSAILMISSAIWWLMAFYWLHSEVKINIINHTHAVCADAEQQDNADVSSRDSTTTEQILVLSQLTPWLPARRLRTMFSLQNLHPSPPAS